MVVFSDPFFLGAKSCPFFLGGKNLDIGLVSRRVASKLGEDIGWYSLGNNKNSGW